MMQAAASTALRNLWRQRTLVGTTLLLGAIILLLLLLVFGLRHAADQTLQSLEQRAEFSLLLREPYNTFEAQALQSGLNQIGVESEIYPAETWEGVAIPPRMRVTFRDLEAVEPAFEQLKNPRYDQVVGDWNEAEEGGFVTVVMRMLEIRSFLDSLSFWLSVLFSIGGGVLTSNTFALLLYARRDEVAVSQLVGAEPLAIALPFVVEGVLLGLGATVLSGVILVVLLVQVTALPGATMLPYIIDTIIVPLGLVAGLVAGLGALLAVRRYLRATPL